jgi:hypothetical protein
MVRAKAHVKRRGRSEVMPIKASAQPKVTYNNQQEGTTEADSPTTISRYSRKTIDVAEAEGETQKAKFRLIRTWQMSVSSSREAECSIEKDEGSRSCCCFKTYDATS